MKTTLCYFNQKYNLYLNDDNIVLNSLDSTEFTARISNKADFGDKMKHGILRLTIYQYKSLFFYSFGIFYDEEQDRPGHNGEWSSNSDYIYLMTGIRLFETSLNRFSVAIPQDKVLDLINDDIFYLEMNGDHGGCSIQSKRIKEPKNMEWFDHDGNPMVWDHDTHSLKHIIQA